MKLRTRLLLYYLLASVVSMVIVSISIIIGIEYTGLEAVERDITDRINNSNSYIVESILSESMDLDEVNQKTIDGIIRYLETGSGGIGLYDNNLRLLGSSSDKKSSFIYGTEHNKLLRKASQGYFAYIVKDNIMYYAAPIKTGNKNLGVLEIIYELNFLNAVLSNSITIFLIGLIVFCLLIILISIIISNKIVKPINKMLAYTNQYANRNFASIPITGSDEISMLGNGLNEMGQQLNKYIEKQKLFVSNVSHELYTPLTAIKGYAFYLRDEVIGKADQEKAVYHISNEASRLEKMVNDLLVMSRIDNKREEFFMEEVNLSDIINDTIENLKIKAQKYKINLIPDIEDGITITADKQKLIQVVVNLIDNAIKYSRKNGKVQIKLFTEGNKACFEVIDLGVGIPEDEVLNIFERFYRCKNVQGIPGTGLGLALVKEIVDRHNGRIEFLSEVDKGTKVIVLFNIKS